MKKKFILSLLDDEETDTVAKLYSLDDVEKTSKELCTLKFPDGLTVEALIEVEKKAVQECPDGYVGIEITIDHTTGGGTSSWKSPD